MIIERIDLALSRLKQGFDSPRERHLVKSPLISLVFFADLQPGSRGFADFDHGLFALSPLAKWARDIKRPRPSL
jgi:hypothetical protein